MFLFSSLFLLFFLAPFQVQRKKLFCNFLLFPPLTFPAEHLSSYFPFFVSMHFWPHVQEKNKIVYLYLHNFQSWMRTLNQTGWCLRSCAGLQMIMLRFPFHFQILSCRVCIKKVRFVILLSYYYLAWRIRNVHSIASIFVSWVLWSEGAYLISEENLLYHRKRKWTQRRKSTSENLSFLSKNPRFPKIFCKTN